MGGPELHSPGRSCRLGPEGRRGRGGRAGGGGRGGERGRLPPASGGEAGPSLQGWQAQQPGGGQVK